ncbi:hypothetical protein BpHYR1_033287 [Brachionus plicatilis]|uniref:Uncharacterized protein n=1 Tax=Brachionus plicatilis TaxID=10195 RepID=A0A3M7R7Q6_BRAPC|nr:hypothetical protein BpHYR1_033287 [Brachionus plicatilis]
MIKTFQIEKRFSRNRSQNEKKRLSCEELETLKERFVDFIDSSALSCRCDTRQFSRLSMSSESADSSISVSRPEPPVRSVSIKNLDDTLSLKSTYSSQTSAVPTCRSVFSIYEDQDPNASMATRSSSRSSSSTLERLSELETQKIESLYRSIGCVVIVSQSTCDLFTTTCDQIADSLNNCWRIMFGNVVAVLVFDTGSNPKRGKQLRLVFVDRMSGLPVIKQLIQIDRFSTLKRPNTTEKCLTFRLNEFVCLFKFADCFCCAQFFSSYCQLTGRNGDLFEAEKSGMSLDRGDRTKRHSAFMPEDDLNRKEKRSSKCGTISKHCISGPCAFQHVNSIRNDDLVIRNILDASYNNLLSYQTKNMAENTLDDLINDLQNIHINKGKITTSQKNFPMLSYGGFLFRISSEENIVKLETGTIFKRKPKYILLDERINEIVKIYSLDTFDKFYDNLSSILEN